jgi:hypothetical protein
LELYIKLYVGLLYKTTGNEEMENSLLRNKSTTRSLVTHEETLIATVLRMTVTDHRQLDLFKALGVDTILELGLLSVEPTHTGRGVQTCLIAGYRLNYVSVLTAWYLFLKVAPHCLAEPL